MEKCGLFENEKINHNIRRHRIGEKLSDKTLANFQPNRFRRCRLGVKNVSSTCRNFHFEEKSNMYFLQLLTRNGIITPKRQR